MKPIKWCSYCLVLLFLGIEPVHAQLKPLNFKLFFEKVYLHTDRMAYMTGDTLWYKAYLTDAQSNQLTVSTANLHVELIAPADSLIAHQTIELKNGLGNGDITLPAYLATGTYRLRAYTNWMRNFGDAFVFEQQLIITNIDEADQPLKKATVNASAKPGAYLSKTSVKENFSKPLQPVVSFYPEGGYMVNGIKSLIAVKANINLPGFKLSAIRGTINNQAGKSVAAFNCDSLGFASFTLKPVAGEVYEALVGYDEKKQTVKLPTALQTGLTLQIVKHASNMKAMISGDKATYKASPVQRLTLTGKHAGKVYFTEAVSLSSVQDSIDIPVESLPQGVTCLTLYDAQMHPQAERLVYISSPKEEALQLNITTNKPTYLSKEKVSLTVKATDALGKPVQLFCSLSAVDADVSTANQSSIAVYLNLQSELKGYIHNPQLYFDTTNVHRHEQLDRLLLTQGWRNFIWRKIIDTTTQISYAPEQGFVLTGRLRQKFANKPLAKKQVVATILQGRTDSHMYLAITDSAGRYKFDNLNVKGKREVQLSALDGQQNKIGWLLVDSIKVDALPVNHVADEDSTSLLQSATVQKLNKVFLQKQAAIISRSIQLKEVKVKENKTYVSSKYAATSFGYPDQVFNITPKDHSYKTLEWFVLQNVKGARASIDTRVTGVQMVSNGKLVPPILIVNGSEEYLDEELDEIKRKLYYNLSIESFEKITFRHLISMGGSDLFLLFLTVKPGATNTPDITKTVMDIDGYYQARAFYEPIYDKPDAIPDYRTTLHWAPNLVTNAKGEVQLNFYNADNAKKVRIVVQGITQTGVPLTAVSTYSVK